MLSSVPRSGRNLHPLGVAASPGAAKRRAAGDSVRKVGAVLTLRSSGTPVRKQDRRAEEEGRTADVRRFASTDDGEHKVRLYSSTSLLEFGLAF